MKALSPSKSSVLPFDSHVLLFGDMEKEFTNPGGRLLFQCEGKVFLSDISNCETSTCPGETLLKVHGVLLSFREMGERRMKRSFRLLGFWKCQHVRVLWKTSAKTHPTRLSEEKTKTFVCTFQTARFIGQRRASLITWERFHPCVATCWNKLNMSVKILFYFLKFSQTVAVLFSNTSICCWQHDITSAYSETFGVCPSELRNTSSS